MHIGMIYLGNIFTVCIGQSTSFASLLEALLQVNLSLVAKASLKLRQPMIAMESHIDLPVEIIL